MGSMEPPTVMTPENNSTNPNCNGGQRQFNKTYDLPVLKAHSGDGQLDHTPENNISRKRKVRVVPLEVGTRVMCRWRDSKYHPVKLIERQRMQCGRPNDYEYYVHYTECKSSG